MGNELYTSPGGYRNSTLKLVDGSRVGVVGGGPAGSFFSFFLLDMAERVRLDIQLDIYEPRDFSNLAPAGCNMCGGIISESLVQTLAVEGINLPPTVVQRGIDSYCMHTDVGAAHIETPRHEKRIGAVHRGGGPRTVIETRWNSFDGYLQSLAVAKGARVIRARVADLERVDAGIQVKTRGAEPEVYDLVAIASGVNTALTRLLGDVHLPYRPPHTTKTAIREYYLGVDRVSAYLGSSMHVFLLDIPRLKFAAIIPKGDYATVCMLGEEIDEELLGAFLNTPEVKSCFPADWRWDRPDCHCSPRLSVKGAVHPFADRLVFIGDSGVSRLYKDGIGAAYRAAKSAAASAVFRGISAADFKRHYAPTCRAMEFDNQIGKLIFAVTGMIQRVGIARKAVLRMTKDEQAASDGSQTMSLVLWDTFTGSAPYQEVFLRTLHPAFLGRFLWCLALSLFDRSSDE